MKNRYNILTRCLAAITLMFVYAFSSSALLVGATTDAAFARGGRGGGGRGGGGRGGGRGRGGGFRGGGRGRGGGFRGGGRGRGWGRGRGYGYGYRCWYNDYDERVCSY